MSGRVGPYRLNYIFSRQTISGSFGGERVTASILGGGMIVGRVAGTRVSCNAVGKWYFCRGPHSEALIPVAALLLLP